MLVCRRLSIAAIVACYCCASASGQVTPTPANGSPQVTEETRDGIKYQVTRQVVQETVPVTVMQDRQQTVQVPKVSTQTISHQQVYSLPVTQYESVPVLHGRWNPFVEPHYTYETQLVTRYQEQVVNVQIPVSKTEWVMETKTVQVPVTEYRTAEREIVTRVAMTGGESNKTYASTTQPAASQSFTTQPYTAPQTTQPYSTYASQPSYSTPATPIPNYGYTQPAYNSTYGQSYSTTPAANVATRPANQSAIGGQMMQADPPRQGSGWSNLPNNGSGYR